MQEYIQPGFAQKQKSREVDKLTAILQALKNCHGSLGTIQGGEDLFQAKEDIADLFLRLDAIRRDKMNRLDSQISSAQDVIDIELEEDSGLALID
jgi:hypothetical protein